jgi:uncharacterized membrane protein
MFTEVDNLQLLPYDNNMFKQPQSLDLSQIPIPQNLKKYNRESGKKTLIFVGIIITLIAIFAILSLIMIAKRPQILTSSIEGSSQSKTQK